VGSDGLGTLPLLRWPHHLSKGGSHPRLRPDGNRRPRRSGSVRRAGRREL